MPAPSSALTNSLISTAYNVTAFADVRVQKVDQFIDNLSSAVLELTPPTITPEFPSGGSAPAVEIPEPPTFDVPIWSSPALPAAFSGALDIDDLQVAPFDIDPPTINYGTAPAAFSGTEPTAPAIDLVFDDPTLSVTLPAAPTLLELDIASFDGITMPTFDADEPTLTAVAPSLREYVPDAKYTSSLLSSLQTILEARIAGGTGLDPAAEDAMWERGREREARAYADAVLKLDQMEALGYSLPPGIFVDARLRLLTESEAAEKGHSREVMIKAAEMALDNVKHAISNATQLEGQLLDYTNSVEQRLFDATRYATEAGVQIYNSQVQAYQAMTEVYRSKVQIYEAQIRAELSKVEAYKAEIGAEEAKARINQTLVEQYKVQIDAALSNIRIFEAEIQGIQTKAEIEKTKVMVYGEQVRGYVASINAYTAGVEGYRATLQAEATKQQVYQSQVDAFSAQVNAGTKQIEARIAAYRGLIDAKNSEYEGYRAAVAGESARIQGLTQVNAVEADAYKAAVQSAGAYNEVLTKQWQATLDQNQQVSRIAIEAAKANSELYITSRSLALEAAKTGALVSAQIGAAAINAFNVSASVSSSEGYNASESVSNSTSRSTSDSTSNNTNYNYSASV
jgi:hypothetical protein